MNLEVAVLCSALAYTVCHMPNRKGPPTPPFDWRDPTMPVIRPYKMADGSRKEIVDPDYEHRYREHLMTAAVQPGFRDDPTYNMKRRK